MEKKYEFTEDELKQLINGVCNWAIKANADKVDVEYLREIGNEDPINMVNAMINYK